MSRKEDPGYVPWVLLLVEGPTLCMSAQPLAGTWAVQGTIGCGGHVPSRGQTMAQHEIYFDEPSDLNRVLDAREVRAILDAKGRGFVRNKRKVMHFLRRVLLTIDELTHRQRALDQLNRGLQMQIAAGTGAAMDPELAVRYLPPERLAELAGGAAQQVSQRAERRRRDYERSSAEVQLRLMKLLERDGMPADVRAALAEVLDVLHSPMDPQQR